MRLSSSSADVWPFGEAKSPPKGRGAPSSMSAVVGMGKKLETAGSMSAAILLLEWPRAGAAECEKSA